MGILLILILFEREFVFIVRSCSISNLYIMKYFFHSIENEGESTLKWANLSALKNKTFFFLHDFELLKLSEIHLYKNKVHSSRGNM